MKCLILSNGPVPAPEQTAVEGGGLRCWGLAKGLAAHGVSVTVAYNESYRKEPFTSESETISIRTYNEGSVPQLIAEFDSVLVSYCMGSLSVAVADAVNPNQQLILDCYVPIYVEASARQTTNLEGEYKAFEEDVKRFSHVLRRGDLFLSASDAQKRFYQGVLAAEGRINPATFGDDPILVVPYGIDRQLPVQRSHPIDALIGGNPREFKKILWFGGIYPWFDLRTLVDAVAKLNDIVPSKLVIVGARNPFNTHPDFLRQYTDLVRHIESGGHNETTILQDWIRFDDRADWYLDADVSVLINKPGLENELAWRTRLVDFIWGGLAVITNGGDPASEMLFSASAAAQFQELRPEVMAEDLRRLLSDPSSTASLRQNIAKVREGLYWDIVTQELAKQIELHTRSKDLELKGSFEEVGSPPQALGARIRRRLKGTVDHVSKYGALSAAKKIGDVAGRKLHLTASASEGPPRVVVISHQLDHSGAPNVIMDFAIDFKRAHPEAPLEFFSFYPAQRENLSKLNSAGIKPKLVEDRDGSIAFHLGDVVVLNTVAHRRQLVDDLLAGLNKGKLAKLHWYVHEDEPEHHFSATDTASIKSLLKKGKLEIWCVARKTMHNYQAYFGSDKGINLQLCRLNVPEGFCRELGPQDFHEKLRFILAGTAGDGRKGQLPVFYAFSDFYHRYFKPNPGQYREFELVFVGLGDDFLSRQLIEHRGALEGRMQTLQKVSRERYLEEFMKSNVSICYSLRESLPMSVFEGMIVGHPILRNDCSGIEEQLEVGKNGFLLPSEDYLGVVEVIERVLNVNKTSDDLLARMSGESVGLAAPYETIAYGALTEATIRSYVHR